MAKRATPAPKKAPLRTVSRKPATPPAQPPNDDNAADLETFHYHVGCIRRAREALELVKKTLKNERRRASDAGINLGDLDLVMKMSEEEPETVRATFNRMAKYANWMGLAPGVQGDLFANATDTNDAEEKAELEGYKEGIEGITAAGDRYDVSNPIGQARLRGWNKGQEVLATRFKPLENPQPEPADQGKPEGEKVPEGATVQ